MASTSSRTRGNSDSVDEYIVTLITGHVKRVGNEKDEIDAPIQTPHSKNEENIPIEPPTAQPAQNLENGKVENQSVGIWAKIKGRVFNKNFRMILTGLQLVLIILMVDLPNPPGLHFVGHMSLLLIAPKIAIYIFNVEEKYFGGSTWIHMEYLFALGVTTLNFIGGLVTTIEYRESQGYLPAGICALMIAILGGIDVLQQ